MEYLNHKFQKVKANDKHALYRGRVVGREVIVTDDLTVGDALLKLQGVGVVYTDNSLADLAQNADEAGLKFRIIGNSLEGLKMGYKKFISELPQAVTVEGIKELFDDEGSLVVLRACDLKPEPISWLWEGWLPLGKLTLLAGAGGAGKTNIALNLASIVTNGGRFPDGTQCSKAGDVLIFSTEDDVKDTLLPRLSANGADFDKIGFLTGTRKNGVEYYFDPMEDFPKVKKYATDLAKHKKYLKLVIIDPIVAVVGGDMHKANDVRHALQPLVDFAAELGCAVVGITHFSKGSKGIDPTERIIGSQAFSALARMAWVATKPDDPDKPCRFAKSKTNIARAEGGFDYEIIETLIQNDIKTTKIHWGEYHDGTAKQQLNDIDFEDDDDKILEKDRAEQFVYDFFQNVPETTFKEIFKEAGEINISRSTLQRALNKICESTGKQIKEGKPYYGWRLKPEVLSARHLEATITSSPNNIFSKS